MYKKPEYLRVYRWNQIDNNYNDIPVFWCNRCLSLDIISIDNSSKYASDKYCDKCLSTDVTVGHIFQWLEMQPKRFYRNLKEYQEYLRRIDWAEYRDDITREIEEEIESLMVNG